MVFYDYFEKLCRERDVTPAQVRKELGISQSTMASWKSRGLTPNTATLARLADYFDTTVDAMLSKALGSDSIKLSDEILYLLRLLDMHNADFVSNQLAIIIKCLNIFEKVEGKVDETTLAEITPAVYACYAITSTLKSKYFGEDIYDIRHKYRVITNNVKRILDSFQQLNVAGRREAVRRINELTYVPKYQKSKDL